MKGRFSKCFLIVFAFAPMCFGAALTQSTITQVVREVSVIDPGTKRQRSAKTSEVFHTPELMRTGPDSRAEMVAPDQTVTRVGSNTVFSFSPEKREVNLQRGSILFQTPTGKGGGTIKTAAATAAVLGTTLIVATTPNGGFKVLMLEGKGKITTPRGGTRMLKAGQLLFIMPGQTFGPVMNFQLREQIAGAGLVRGFKTQLPSMGKIDAAIKQQQKEIETGTLNETGVESGAEPEVGIVEVEVDVDVAAESLLDEGQDGIDEDDGSGDDDMDSEDSDGDGIPDDEDPTPDEANPDETPLDEPADGSDPEAARARRRARQQAIASAKKAQAAKAKAGQPAAYSPRKIGAGGSSPAAVDHRPHTVQRMVDLSQPGALAAASRAFKERQMGITAGRIKPAPAPTAAGLSPAAAKLAPKAPARPAAHQTALTPAGAAPVKPKLPGRIGG